MPATPAPVTTNSHELLFIADNVTNTATLLAALRPGVVAHRLEAGCNGLDQMAEVLAQHSGLSAVHIVSHGAPGRLQLGTLELNRHTLAQHRDRLAEIGNALAEGGDLLLYGCEVGAGAVGRNFVAQLADAAGAHVAASPTVTGAQALGGNWSLSLQCGPVQTALAFERSALGAYPATLPINDENFDGLLIDSIFAPTWTRGLWTFGQDAGGSMNVDDTFNTPFSGLAHYYNTWNDGGINDFWFASADGTNFDLVSFRLASVKSLSNTVTVSGWRDGVQVVPDEVVVMTTSDALGQVQYTRQGEGSVFEWGLFTLGTAFDNVDRINLAFSAMASLILEDIDVSPAPTPPTATIVLSDSSLAIGDTASVTFTFSEAVNGFANADITVANGSLSAVSTSDGGTTWTATFTPSANIEDITNLISVDMTGVNSASSSLAGVGTQSSNNYTIDTLRPTVTLSLSDTALRAGETSTVTLTFSERCLFPLGTAWVTMPNGTLSAPNFSANSWSAVFTPSPGVTDSTNQVSVSATVVYDQSFNQILPVVFATNYTVDTVRPSATLAMSDTSLAIGQTSNLTITFSEPVTGFSNPSWFDTFGTVSTPTTTDGITWTAVFTPAANTTNSGVMLVTSSSVQDAAGNGLSGLFTGPLYTVDTQRPTATLSVSDTALRQGSTTTLTVTFSEAVTGFTSADLIAPNGTLSSVTSGDGGITWTATFTPSVDTTDATNIVTLDNTGVTDLAGNTGSGSTNSGNYAIDTLRPTATLAISDTVLTAGETAVLTVTFSEAVTGFTSADLSAPNGSLSGLASGDGGITWTATFTPSAATSDATNVITLANAGVTDLAGNTGSGSTDSGNYAIDTLRPTATLTINDTLLTAGETAVLTVSFSEAVTGFSTADLSAPNGTLSSLTSGDGGVTWTATFTPSVDTTDATNIVTLANAGVTDWAGNTGSGSTDSSNYAIDTLRPTATLAISDAALTAGETAVLTATFSEAVTGFTTADLNAPNGSLSGLTSGDGGITWTATFTPSAGVSDATNVITLANTGVTDLAGNTGIGTAVSSNYQVDIPLPPDTEEPMVLGHASTPQDNANGVAVNTTLVLHFSEPLAPGSVLTGVSLRDVANQQQWPVQASINASGQLVIDPTMDLAGLRDYSVQWPSGALRDAAGNAVSGTLDNFGAYNFRTAADPGSIHTVNQGTEARTTWTVRNPDTSQNLTDIIELQTKSAVLINGNNTPLLSVSAQGLTGSVSSMAVVGSSASVPAQLTQHAQALWTLRGGSPDASAAALMGDLLQQYIAQLPANAALTLRTLSFDTITATPNSTGGAPQITVRGSAGGQEALFIDARSLPPGTQLVLENTAFAYVIGAARIEGGAGANTVITSATGGTFISLGPDDDVLHGGLANDVVASRTGDDQLFGHAGNDWIVGGPGNDRLDGGAGNDILQGGASDAGTWLVRLGADRQVVSSYQPIDAALGNPAPFSSTGNLGSDDRLAFSGLSADRLQAVALLHEAVTHQLPTLPALNQFAASNASDAELALLAFNHFTSQNPAFAGSSVENQVRTLANQVWGSGTATDTVVPLGVSYIEGGGSWVEALAWLAQHTNNRASVTTPDGQLNLTQPWRSGEMGWGANSGNDLLRGGDGDDRLIGGGGNDALDGGAGLDTAVFFGTLAQYSIRKQAAGDGTQWALQGPLGEVDTLINIERLSIGGKTYAMNEAFAALPFYVDQALSGLVVEVAGVSASSVDVIGW
jgi:hypothetical protein